MEAWKLLDGVEAWCLSVTKNLKEVDKSEV